MSTARLFHFRYVSTEVEQKCCRSPKDVVIRPLAEVLRKCCHGGWRGPQMVRWGCETTVSQMDRHWQILNFRSISVHFRRWPRHWSVLMGSYGCGTTVPRVPCHWQILNFRSTSVHFRECQLRTLVNLLYHNQRYTALWLLNHGSARKCCGIQN